MSVYVSDQDLAQFVKTSLWKFGPVLTSVLSTAKAFGTTPGQCSR